MKSIDDLLEEMATAVAANDQASFDDFERQLLDRFDGGFSGMPKEVYARYLEVDRAWPAIITPPQRESSDAPSMPNAETGATVTRLGPRTMVSARLPESLLEWLRELGTASGANRSELLTACLLLIREDPSIHSKLLDRLRESDS